MWEECGIGGDIFVRHFKFYREVRENVILVRKKQKSDQPLSEFKFYYNGTLNSLYLIAAHRKIRKRQNESIRVSIEGSNGNFSGNGSMSGVCLFRDVFAGIVEINKQLHLHSLGFPERDPRIRVVSVSNFNVLELLEESVLTVKISLITKKSFQGFEFTLAKVLWSVGEAEQTMELCFSFEKG